MSTMGRGISSAFELGCFFAHLQILPNCVILMIVLADYVVDDLKKATADVANAIVDGARSVWDWISFWD